MRIGMRRDSGRFTAVTLCLLLVLAACGGAITEQEAQPETATDVEATGSEKIGDMLPTPISGVKALPTRANAATLMPDILLIAPSTMLTGEDLNAVVNQAAFPNARLALALYGDAGPTGVFDFTEGAAGFTAVPDAPETQTQPVFTLPAALAAGLQLPGWRPDSAPRLILLVVDGALPDDEMMTLAATAVAQNMRLYILQTDESADWVKVAVMGNGRVLLLPGAPMPNDIGTAVTALVAEASTD